MCVTYCHRRRVLYWNHEDCDCDLAQGPHGRCETCRHCQAGICRATNAPLPEAGGCCHWGVELTRDWQVVTLAMLELLGVAPTETELGVLVRWDAPYHLQNSRMWVAPGELGLPDVYGAGTETTGVGEEGWPW